MEALLVSRISAPEILVGKLIPYFILGMGGLLLSLAMAHFLFHVPMRGSLWLLLGSSALFLWVALGMGFFISTVFKSQFVAALVAMVSTFLPAFILSGFIFDIRSMPELVQGLTHLIAARYYVSILQTLFLVGNVWSVILPNSLALVLMGLFFSWDCVRKNSKEVGITRGDLRKKEQRAGTVGMGLVPRQRCSWIHDNASTTKKNRLYTDAM